MEATKPTLQGAERRAMWDIGQASQRRRWAWTAHRRPVFHARRTALRSPCGQPDHGGNRALPADVENRSSDSIKTKLALAVAAKPARQSDETAKIQKLPWVSSVSLRSRPAVSAIRPTLQCGAVKDLNAGFVIDDRCPGRLPCAVTLTECRLVANEAAGTSVATSMM